MKIKNYNINIQKIPLLPDITSWKDVEIRECGEKLIFLNELYPKRIFIESQYFSQGLEGSIKECFVRETVAKMLIEVSKRLPNDYKLVIWDAWRPIEVQKAIFYRYKEKLKNLNPEVNEENLFIWAQKYISLPSVDENKPSPHSTGGAVDLSIIDSSGNYLNMGTAFDDFSIKANTRYYEQLLEKGKALSDNDLVILNNRRLLFHTMTDVGFTNYLEEWWHYDYGNQFWAKSKGVSAIYGKITIQDGLSNVYRVTRANGLL